MSIIAWVITFIDNHTGMVVWAIVGLALLALYLRGQGQGFWPFLRETLSERDPSTGMLTASTKRMTLLASLWVVLWGYAKLTLAVCRWVDRGGDPTAIYITLALGVLGLAGGTYLGGQWLKGKLPPGLLPGPPSTDTDTCAK
jgi:hypothetical protein